MTQPTRQLAAIMFTDIVGYTRMMGQDEDEAAKLRSRHRDVLVTITEKHGGEILQYYGDGTLSIFSSSLQAATCAIEIQRALQKDPVVPLRIGLHTGDIVYSDEEVYGDGVNMASRIESACIPGGVFISGKVYDDIKNHSEILTKDVGSFKLKNVDKEVKLYALVNDGLVSPEDNFLEELTKGGGKAIPSNSIDKVDAKLRRVKLSFLIPILIATGLFTIVAIWYFGTSPNSNKPGMVSIAVLPFANLTSGEEHEYFSDGITEDILTLLSSIEGFKVISRTSVMQYKNTPKNVREIGKELQVDHILEGSVRKDGNKVRIVAQLINARTDEHIWAQTYDHTMEEIFAIQSSVAEEIANALEHELSPDSKERIEATPTHSISAYELYLQGRQYYQRYTYKDNLLAIQLFRQAIALDSAYALAWAGLGDAFGQHGERFQKNYKYLDSALSASKIAIRLDPGLSEGYKALGLAYHYQFELDAAMEQYEKAIDINPNNDMAVSNMGSIHLERGNLRDGIKLISKAIELDPFSNIAMVKLADGYYKIGMKEAAMNWIEKSLLLNPENVLALEAKSSYLMADSKYDLANRCVDELFEMDQNSFVAYLHRGYIFALQLMDVEAEKNFLIADTLMRVQNRGIETVVPNTALAFVYMRTAREEKGLKLAEESIKKLLEYRAKENPDYEIEVYIAYAYIMFGENEKAMDHLEEAVRYGWREHLWVDMVPYFDDIRDEPRFKELIQNLSKETAKIMEEFKQPA